MPSKKLWGYIAKLEKAIKEVMESSPEIAELVEKIQGEGVEVSLNCIALFSDTKGRSFTSPAGKITRDGHKRRDDVGDAPPPAKGKRKTTRKRAKDAVAPSPKGGLELNEKDREFLKSIGIRFD